MSAFIRFIIFLFFIAIILLAFYFSNANTTVVPLWLGIDLAPQRIGVWVVIAFSLGGLMGLLLGFGLFKRIKYRVQLKQLKSKLKKAEEQLSDLKTGTIKDLK